ncbi:hypothetical protein Nepgr_027479 [Nepenthes gracilis]|uniref:Transmembrane protein n=1 Tax=Nepenthes gracilis TaxID=150966 RepID=A0AAD3Y3K5_NEPGR|nr:hypothetical protein Nepgr_027479 [Nepenthes gracilis]
MDENPHQISHKNRTHKSSRSRDRRNCRFTEEETGDLIECSGKHCLSCTAALIADSVAVCCCPLAVVSLLALAFVKVPYMLGRRCLGLGKMRKTKGKCKKIDSTGDEFVKKRGVSLTSGREKEGKSDSVFEFGCEETDKRNSLCARFEAENFFLELYEVGQLGFGRVSFHGIQSCGKSN